MTHEEYAALPKGAQLVYHDRRYPRLPPVMVMPGGAVSQIDSSGRVVVYNEGMPVWVHLHELRLPAAPVKVEPPPPVDTKHIYCVTFDIRRADGTEPEGMHSGCFYYVLDETLLQELAKFCAERVWQK